MSKRKLGPCVTFFPQPATLVTTMGADGRPDVMTVSWAGVVSKTPPTMAVALNQARKSYANIRETGGFVVNAAPASLATEVDYCGLRSGRDEDKLAVAGLQTAPADQVKAPLLSAAPLNVECRFTQEVEIGEYRLVLGEILEIHADEDAFGPEGQMDARVFDPLVYLGGIREYWSLGEKKGDAYRDGKKLMKSGG